MRVSISNIMVETCITVCMTDTIRVNDKIVYLHISALLLGLTAPMIQIVGGCVWYKWYLGMSLYLD